VIKGTIVPFGTCIKAARTLTWGFASQGGSAN
jgi:hypothetical protein